MFLDENFECGGTIGNLDSTKGQFVGIYIIVLPGDFGAVQFVEPSKAFRLKGKDPTVPISKLNQKLVDGAKILYIGESENTVFRRIKEHIKFWSGQHARAWGGRTIAQIQNYESLKVYYLKSDNPKKTESELLTKFMSIYGKLPFANWRLEKRR